jgi:hypothetical protein
MSKASQHILRDISENLHWMAVVFTCGGALMLAVLAHPTLWKMKNKKSYFCGLVVLRTTQHNTTELIR